MELSILGCSTLGAPHVLPTHPFSAEQGDSLLRYLQIPSLTHRAFFSSKHKIHWNISLLFCLFVFVCFPVWLHLCAVRTLFHPF